ncbi:MAG: S-layer homology domain-containing protein [Prochlorothrix sp.]
MSQGRWSDRICGCWCLTIATVRSMGLGCSPAARRENRSVRSRNGFVRCHGPAVPNRSARHRSGPVGTWMALGLLLISPSPIGSFPSAEGVRRDRSSPVSQAGVLSQAPLSRRQSPHSPVLASPSPGWHANPFHDLSASYWATEFIVGLADRSVIHGFPDGSFRPNAPITRAQFAVLLVQAFPPPRSSPTGSIGPTSFPTADPVGPGDSLNALTRPEPTNPSQPDAAVATNPPASPAPSGLPIPQSQARFRDVPSHHWAAAAIAQAQAQGFLRGYPDGHFQPDRRISRLEMLLALAAGLGYGPEGSVDRLMAYYNDYALVPSEAWETIAAVTERQMVVSYPDPRFLNPHRPATRAEVAAVLYQALVSQGQVMEIASPYIVSFRPRHLDLGHRKESQ